jgi:hypothetical protein
MYLVITLFHQLSISTGGNPGFGQQNLVQGTIPTQGESTRVFSSQGIWNPWQGSVPSQWISTGGNPFHGQWNLGKGSVPMPVGLTWGNPFHNIFGTQHRRNPCPTLVIQLQESVDDILENAVSIHYSRPWCLPEPWPTTQSFLATWCQSNSRPPFSCT